LHKIIRRIPKLESQQEKKLATNKSVLHFLSHNPNVKFILYCKNVVLEKEREREKQTCYIFSKLVIYFPASSLLWI